VSRVASGQLVLERYTLEQEIALGGMGAIWTAVDPDGRQVAIKLLAEIADDPNLPARLAREAALLARVKHPNVIGLIDHGVIGRAQPVVVLELVNGRALDVVLRERGALRYALAVDWAEQILAGLGALHAAAIVHRDIKPANVLVTVEDDFVLKIIDLGAARSLRAGTGRITKDGRTVGTLDYMAPEQLADAAVDARADVYATGLVLYQMLTGKAPAPGMQGAMARMVRPLPAPVAPEHLPELPPRLIEAVMTMLAIKPTARPVDAATAAARLVAGLR